jgi:hypothetical protein
VKLEPVMQRLRTEEAVGFDTKTFAQTIAGLLQLMEDALGKNVRGKKENPPPTCAPLVYCPMQQHGLFVLCRPHHSVC